MYGSQERKYFACRVYQVLSAVHCSCTWLNISLTFPAKIKFKSKIKDSDQSFGASFSSRCSEHISLWGSIPNSAYELARLVKTRTSSTHSFTVKFFTPSLRSTAIKSVFLSAGVRRRGEMSPPQICCALQWISVRWSEGQRVRGSICEAVWH